jgi:hypothetical protein
LDGDYSFLYSSCIIAADQDEQLSHLKYRDLTTLGSAGASATEEQLLAEKCVGVLDFATKRQLVKVRSNL